MPLLQLLAVDFSIGGPLLLDKVDFALEPGERVAVVGRNGAGKSTLLRLIAGEIRPDDGEVRRSDGLSIAALAQEVPQGMHGSVFDVVAGALGEIGDLLADYHHLIHADAATMASAVHQERLTAVHERIDALSGWNLEQRVERTLSRYGLDPEADFDRLSGGMKRRVLLARATVGEPDLLLLDEPTNHLDLAAIEWLESMVREFPGAVVFVTHDRRFLRQLATRIVEIDRGALTSWPGDYDNYLRRREERAHAEAEMTARFDKKLAEEEIWIRQGVKARRTRAEARVQALVKMRGERAARREQSGKVKLELAQAATSGKLVAEATGLGYAVGGRTLIRDFDATVLRGDRIGIIGPNGSGKTTLLRLLLGELAPTSGSVRSGSKLEIAYFDQYRRQLDEAASTMDNVADGADTIEFNGSRRHVLGYLQDFLFSPERARAPITKLSGGERNRLLLARLFARPSNLLVMDEPTNDLDVETLELLEELLANYPGTLLLVSHDRDFLDAVVTSTFVLEGDGAVREYVGGYSDWIRQRPAAPAAALEKQKENSVAAAPSPASSSPGATTSVAATASAVRRRLNNKEQRELAALPGRIEALDAEIAALQARMGTPEFFRQDGREIAAANARLAELTTELDAAYARWQELE